MSDWCYEGWEFFVHDLGRPKRVLLTTFGLDPEFLVTELLTELLQISAPRNSAEWFVEMEDALKHCPVDVVVDARQWAASSRAPLFQSLGGRVHPVFVPNGNQHAKLWMAEYGDKVRIAVGSANLIRSGFCGQIQYLWMTDLKARRNPTKKLLNPSLERLQSFLKEVSASIAASQGTSCSWSEKRVYLEWDNVLKTRQWPEGVRLIPVIPPPDQLNDNQEGDALKILSGEITDQNYIVDIQVFSVGQLNTNFVQQLKSALHASKLNLLWPEARGLPNEWAKMVITCATAQGWGQLTGGKIYPLMFLTDVVKAQVRIPHGKLYAGRKKRVTPQDETVIYDWLLIGSSNLSSTAWKESFELNVLIQKEGLTLPLDRCPNNRRSINFPHCVAALPVPPTGTCSWLEAYETSSGIEVLLHGAALSGTYTAEVLDAVGSNIGNSAVTNWPPGTKQSVTCMGKDARRVVATQTPAPPTGAASLECPVIPLPDSQIAVIAPGKTPDEIRHEWILGYYGWDPERVRHGSYRTAWLEESMNVFRVIDAWREAGKDIKHKDLLKNAFLFFKTPKPLDVGPPPQSDLHRAFSVAQQEIAKW